MRLQLALDMLHTAEAMNVLSKVVDNIDIIEIGTPLLKHEGVAVVRKICQAFPEKKILVDLKTMDVGEYEADFAFEAGADIVTVLAVADMETIKGAKKSAQNHSGELLVDLIGVSERRKTVAALSALGVDYLGLHSGIDQQRYGCSPLEGIDEIQAATSIPLAIAGGINLEILADVIRCRPEIIVVGGAITGSSEPEAIVVNMKEMIDAATTSECC